MSRRATARPNTTAHQAVGSLRRATEEPAAGEKRQMNSLADDRPHGWEPLQVRTREEKRGRAVAQREETQGNITVRQHAVHEQQLQRVKEEHVGERLRPGAQPNSVLTTAPALRRDGLPPCRPSLQSEEAGRVDWAALQVSIPRLEVKGPTGNIVTDRSSSSSISDGGSFTATAAALSDASSRAHEWQGMAGVQASPVSTSAVGEGSAATLLAVTPSDEEIDGIARGNGTAATVSATTIAASLSAVRPEGGGLAASSLFRGVSGGTLDQPRSPPPSPPLPKATFLVGFYVDEEGKAVYSFNVSAPSRRGKWSRAEEEYAKRIIRDFDEGVIDAPAGIGLRQLLSSKLHCELMRVSKKFCGWQCVGKRCYRPVFHPDGRAARASSSLFEMEQAWLKTFPCPTRFERSRKPAVGGDGAGGGSTKPADGGLEHPAPLSPAGGVGGPGRGATPAQMGDNSTAEAVESLAKEEQLCSGSSSSEHSDEEARNAGEQGQEAQKRRRDGRGLVSPVTEGGDQQQQQQQAASRSGGHAHRRHHSVGAGGGGSRARPHGRNGMNRHSWDLSSSHGSHYMQGGSPIRKPVANPREQHLCEKMRSPPTGLSFWQRPEADRLPSSDTGGCDRNADLYPVFSRRGEGNGDVAAAVQRVVEERAIAGGGDEVPCASGYGWARGQAARQPQSPRTDVRSEGEHARENTQEHHRNEVRALIVSGAPAGRTTLLRREHDMGRHEAPAADEMYPRPPPRFGSGRQLAGSGGNTPHSGGDSGGRAARGDGGRRPTDTAAGRRPFRLKSAVLPLHLRVHGHEEAFFPGYKQAAVTTAPERERYSPETSYRVAPPPEPSPKRRFGEGQNHRYLAAKEEIEDPAAGLEEHRPTKVPRTIGSHFCVGTGGRSGGRDSDDLSCYPRYREQWHQYQLQQQQQQQHPATATAQHWQPWRAGGNSDACVAEESYRRASLGNPMGGNVPPSTRPPSGDCFSRVSAPPVFMAVPSNEYDPDKVGPGRAVHNFCAF